jgi:hypothetical protein
MLFVPQENLISLYVKEDSKNKNEKKKFNERKCIFAKKRGI